MHGKFKIVFKRTGLQRPVFLCLGGSCNCLYLRYMKPVAILFSIFLLYACNAGKNNSEHYCRTHEPADSADYKHSKCGFYTGKNGKLYERKVQVDKSDSNYCYAAFYDEYMTFYAGDNFYPKELDSVIDLETYTCIDSSCYAKDKNNCYYYYDNSDGGFRFVVTDADPATFRKLKGYHWAADSKRVYYRGNPVEGLNRNKFQLLQNSSQVDYIKDDRHVFYENDSIAGADAGSFRQVEGRAWDAEDKHHQYNFGQIIN